MASSARRLAVFSRSSSFSTLLFNNSRAGYLGLFKIRPRCTELFTPIHALRFKSTFNFPKVLVQGITSPALRKGILKGCAGLSFTSAIICQPPNIAYAMNDYTAESPGGDVKEDFNTAWAIARKYQLPLVMLAMLLLGWRHPIITAINAIFFLFCTRPSPYSIYLFVEHLRRRDMNKDQSLRNTKLLYTRKVEVEDYKLVCYGKVELRDRKLHLFGILGGWWIFHVSYI
ncbi:hypothetical protein LUZ63_007686 [Rhynchospora breviuscula]|uniref:Uncharacterized protein n=1 Tax=Rhynchospora breviuscula TaxID=2022672 RepID=A0A9Q0CS51_9POAL|nr:hypothetical protein LUZ63_007686 [Rhynchospora breviuscula]